MLISSHFPVVLVDSDTLVLRSLVLSDMVEKVLADIERQVPTFLPTHKAKKIFLRDFFLASLLSGHIKCGERDMVLIDISNDSFLEKRGGIYREEICKLQKRKFQLTLEEWAQVATELVSKTHILESVQIEDGKTTMIEPNDWPKIIKKNQILVELGWRFQDVFFQSCLPYLEGHDKN